MKNEILAETKIKLTEAIDNAGLLPKWEKPVLKVLSVTKNTLGDNTGTNFDNDTFDNTDS